MGISVGIDVGTSSAKAVALAGVDISSSFRTTISPPSNTAELWTLLEDVLAGLLPPEERARVRCLCVSGRAPTLVGIRSDCQEGPVISWEGASTTGTGDRYYLDSVAKSLMVKDRDQYNSCRFFVNPHEFLTYRLTGIVRSSTPSQLYHPWGGFLTEAARRIREMRIDPAKVAPAIPVGTVVGRISEASARRLGVDPSAMVVMGGWDFMMDLLGSGVIMPGEILVRAGTSLAVDALWPEALTVDGFFSTPHFVSGLYVLGKLIRPASTRSDGRPPDSRVEMHDEKTAREVYSSLMVQETGAGISVLSSVIGNPLSIVCSGQNSLKTDFCAELARILGRSVERVGNSMTEAQGAATVASVASGLTPTYEDHVRAIKLTRELVKPD